MSIYDDAKSHFGLIAAVALASFASAWACFEGYGKYVGIDRVPANTYVLLKDLRDTHISRPDHDKLVSDLKKNLDDLKEPQARLESCAVTLETWKTSHGQWKQNSESCHAALAGSRTNCSLLDEVRRLERQKTLFEREMWTLSSEGVNGNPSDGISKGNQSKFEINQRAVRDLEFRALELTKHLTCG